MGVGAAAGDRRPAADGGAADPGLRARDAQARHPLGARRLEVGPAGDGGAADPASSRRPSPTSAGPGASKSDPPPIPPDEYDGDAGGPRSLDDVIFD